MVFNYYMPVDIHFGYGSLSKVGEVARRFGFKGLIVTGKSSKKHGYLDKVISNLILNNIRDVIIYDEIEPNPTDISVNKGARISAENKVDFIIGLGGGSILDAAKAIAIVSSNEGFAWEYVFYPEGPKSIPYYTRPVIAIPTTAGTGSEVNKYSVISNPNRKEKLAIAHSLNYPKVAIVDPELTMSMDKNLTATTGIDAFYHAFESYTNKLNNRIAEDLDVVALKLILKWLEIAYEDVTNKEARENMSYGAMLAGIAIDQKRAGIIHAMEHPISGRYPQVAHAKGLSALGYYVTLYNIKRAPEKYRKLALELGLKDEYHLLETLKNLTKKLNLPLSLKELGIVPDEELPRILAEDVYFTGRNAFNINPAEITEKEVELIYKASLFEDESLVP